MDSDSLKHHFGGNTYIREESFKAGALMMQHVHKDDHQSILGCGDALLILDGVVTELTGPCVVFIPAGKRHALKAVTDVTWFCIRGTEETDPQKIDHETIADPDMTPLKAYEEMRAV